MNGVRILAVFGVLTGVLITVALLHESSTSLPRLSRQNELFKRVLNPEHITTFKTEQNAAYAGLRNHVGKSAESKYGRNPRSTPVAAKPVASQIRAGFYVNWDAQSFYSLRTNIDKITVVFPEWLFLSDGGDSLAMDIDARALALLRDHHVPIAPMLSNYIRGTWNGESVRRLVTSPEKRRVLIGAILAWLEENQFSGINIDFENLPGGIREDLVVFQRELYHALHQRRLLTTQDVAPYSTTYDLRELQRYNDFIVVMAYDMHYAGSDPGPIADARWVASVLTTVSRSVEPAKIIVGLAGYAYDWPENGEGEDITYEEAMVRAEENDGTISFDSTGYNLSFRYADETQRAHQVWFTDAATLFNIMRTVQGYGTAGFALWRLGGEDPRLWRFYGRTLSDDALREQPFDPGILSRVRPPTNVDFEGEGEILDVVATPDSGLITVEYDSVEMMITGEDYEELPSAYIIRRSGKVEKQMVLTFDDGPNETYTPAILDILKQEHVPAAFFILGVNAEDNLSLLSRIYSEGHEIGNHTFTHPNLAEVGSERTALELNATRRIIESVTSHSTILFRAPYNADSEPETMDEIIPVVEAKRHNYYTVGESIDPEDWQPGITADTILARIIKQENNGNVILLHDAGGDRSQTVAALPRIIQHFRDKGYTFTTVAALTGKTRDDVMPPLADRRSFYLSRVNWLIAEGISWSEQIILKVFLLAIILSVLRTASIALLAWLQKRRERSGAEPLNRPLVSVVIPAYNEEVTAPRTVRTLLQSEYPHLEIIFVDDGSTDRTYDEVRQTFSEYPNVRVLTKPNGGKASALNHGIAAARGELLLCIDADTQLKPDAVSRLVRIFVDDEVGAVAGNVKVGNKSGLLTRWQAIEYVTSQNFDRRAFDLLNCITVVPGAIGGFRKAAIDAAGGFTTDTLAEDCDLTLRILKAGYAVRYCDDGIGVTEAPETLSMFLKQRFRWTFGTMQCVWKHRALMFDPQHGTLGMVALPNTMIFQFLLPLFAPLTDIMFVWSLLAGLWEQTLIYYAAFTVVEAAAAFLAYRFERENAAELWLLLPQRVVYRQLMYWVLFKSYVAALRGGLVGWGILKRMGTVRMTDR